VVVLRCSKEISRLRFCNIYVIIKCGDDEKLWVHKKQTLHFDVSLNSKSRKISFTLKSMNDSISTVDGYE